MNKCMQAVAGGDDSQRIHQRDPAFVAIFDHASLIDIEFKNNEHGVFVKEMENDGGDDCTVTLIQTHARVADDFIARGPPDMHSNHL
jgi:hypothetical protein